MGAVKISTVAGFSCLLLGPGSYPAIAQTGPGTALSFDGVNDYVSVPSTSSLNLGSQFTIELWLYQKAANVGSGFRLVDKETSGLQDGYLLDTYDGVTGRKLRMAFGGGVWPASAAYTLNTWHHAAATYNSGTLSFYLDGATNGAFTGVAAPASNALDLRIGAPHVGCGGGCGLVEYFNGIVDEVRIWNVARSQAQIQANMNRSLSLPQTNLVGYWRFDEGTGTNAFDSSGLGNTGILTNGPLWVSSTVPFQPTVTTELASAVTTNSATLNGTVNPNGLFTLAWFQWGTTTNYGNITGVASLGSASSALLVQAGLSGLANAVSYHYRTIATNSASSVTGNDQMFTAVQQGVLNSWVSPFSGKWETPQNWSVGVPSPIFDTVYITNTGSKTVSIDATTATFSNTMTVTNLTLTAPGGATNALALSNIPANSPLHVVANLSILPGGILTINSSTLTVDNGIIPITTPNGSEVELDGVVNVNSGFLNTSNAMYTTIGGGIFGGGGAGSVVMDSSTFTPHNLIVGYLFNGTATFANCNLRLGDGLTMGSSGAAVGNMAIYGGQCIVTNNYFGPDSPLVVLGVNGTGNLIVSNANVQFGNTTIGDYGSGSLTLQSGSSVSLGKTFLGLQASQSSGTISVAAGQISMPELHVGVQGTGTVTVVGGTLTAPIVTVGETNTSVGTLNINGGTALISSLLQVGTNNSTATVSIAAGALLVSNAFQTAVLDVRNGIVALNGGALTADTLAVWSGQFVFNSGTLELKGARVSNGAALVVGDGSAPATLRLLGGSYTFADGLTVMSNSVLYTTGATIQAPFVNNGTLTFDVPAALIFLGSTINNGTILASGGATIDFYGPVEGNGSIVTTTGATVRYHAQPAAGPVVINEWMASNVTTLTNPATGLPDPWLELYNTANNAVDLSGFYLTSTPTNPAQYRIATGVVIPAHGFVQVWADGGSGEGGLGGFRLTNDAGMIGLYAPDFALVDEVYFGRQIDDISQGRWPDGNWASYFMNNASPGSSNTNVPQNGFSPFLGECTDFQVVNVTPVGQSGETSQNSEPNIAVSKQAGICKSVLLSAFAGVNVSQPYYSATPCGCPHFVFSDPINYVFANGYSFVHGDTTIAWGSVPYRAVLYPDQGMSQWWTQDVHALTFPNPNGVTGGFTTFTGARAKGGPFPNVPDQPWIEVLAGALGSVPSQDHIYVTFNNNPASPKTASVVFSTDAGATWTTAAIEKVSPPLGQDLPPVRSAPAHDGQTVYALFERANPANAVGDFPGDLILVRDDTAGLGGFAALGNGTIVAQNIAFPWATSLGNQRTPCACSMAVDPQNKYRVYVAYTEVASENGANVLRLRISASYDGGAHIWPNLFTATDPAALPALAVAKNGTVGLLYTAFTSGKLETHFVQFPYLQYLSPGDGFSGPQFDKPQDFILSTFPDGTPSPAFQPYIGDYQDLEAVDNVFYGCFSASGDPDPMHFPNGAYFQRFVDTGVLAHSVQSESYLERKGNLVANSAGTISVAKSIDPYFFVQRARVLKPVVSIPKQPVTQCSFFGGKWHCYPVWDMTWPKNQSGTRQWRLESTDHLGPPASWSPVPEAAVENLEGEFSTVVRATEQSRFFRLSLEQSNAAPHNVFAAAGSHGGVFPIGITNVNDGQTLNFTAAPDMDYFVEKWYLDGAIAQSGGANFTVSSIQEDHHITVVFAPLNDLFVTQTASPWDGDQEADTVDVGGNLTYTITIANDGINSSTGVRIVDNLPTNLTLISASATTGSCSVTGRVVTCVVGTLARGASVTMNIVVAPTAEGVLTNTATVTGNEFEIDLSNNSYTAVIEAVTPIGANRTRSFRHIRQSLKQPLLR